MGNELLVIGKLPPPIGGVSVHVSRLIKYFHKVNYNFNFFDLKEFNLLKLITNIHRCKIAHIHLSRPIYIISLVLMCKLLNVKVVLTIHANIGRFSYINKILLNLSIYITDIPIVLNEESFAKAFNLNYNVKKLGAFINDCEQAFTENEWTRTLKKIISENFTQKPIVATSAWNFVLDHNGDEVYGIYDVIEWSKKNNLILIVFDPSGNYKSNLEKVHSLEGSDIVFLNGNFDFINAVRFCDLYVRNTTTDGDSLSLHEVLLNGKPVWATDVVTRPKGVNLFKTLDEIDVNKLAFDEYSYIDIPSKLIKIYSSILDNEQMYSF